MANAFHFRFSLSIMLAVLTLFVLAGCGLRQQTSDLQNRASGAVNAVKRSTADIVEQAKEAYDDAKSKRQDLQNGPCLGTIAPDWVLDIAHSPRQPADDLPENQCAAYRDGSVHHFIELTPQGSLIRIY